MKSSCSFPVLHAVMACLLLLFLASSTATAFTPRGNVLVSRSTTTTTRFYYETEEASEWYSPPPPPTPPPVDAAAVPASPAITVTTTTTTSSIKLPRGVTPKTTVIRSRADLEIFLAEDDRLCLVKFHASWCKSCQKFNLHFAKLANQYADWVSAVDDKKEQEKLVKRNPVRIAEVEWGANVDLCKALGVEKLPSVHFYADRGVKLNAIAAGPSRFGKVRHAVARYAASSPSELAFEAKLEQGKQVVEEAARLQRMQQVAVAREERRRARSTPPRQQLARNRRWDSGNSSESSSSSSSPPADAS